MRKIYFIAFMAIPFFGFAASAVQSPPVEQMPPSTRPQAGQGGVSNVVIETSIEGVYGNGKYLVMQDDSKWEVREKDWNKTGGWLGPADVRITRSNDANYPYKILNKWTNSIIYAKPVDEVTDSLNPQSIP